MKTIVAEAIHRHCHPLPPRPTEVAARLEVLPDICAVLFDIYGTLLVSGAGDITLQSETASDDAFRAVLVEAGLAHDVVSRWVVELLREVIAGRHAANRLQGIAFPEVDIVDVWREVVQRIAGDDRLPRPALAAIDPARLAVEYELRLNPVWPMPGMIECLEDLASRGLLLGLVSNAQAMTLELFPALVNRDLTELGFAPDLQFFSYRCGESKPSPAMFNAAATALRQHGLATKNAVYIGNDMLNDVWAAEQAGFRTILFAGDARSLRLRADDERLGGCSPDCVVKDLQSIGLCLGGSSQRSTAPAR